MNAAKTKDWIAANRDLFWDLLRVYLGVALFIKGFVYLRDASGLVRIMSESGFPFSSPALAKWVALTHMAGGLLLAFGLLTRLAAAAQIPNLLGAVFIVHMKDGLFTRGQTLELASLVLVLLAFFAVVGAGRWSIDFSFASTGNAPLQKRHRGVMASMGNLPR